jgi:phosphatidate phosphatase APP1
MKYLKIFEQFVNEYSQNVKPKWNGEDFKKLYDQLIDKAKEAAHFLDNPPFETYEELLELLDEHNTEDTSIFAHEIRNLIGMLQYFNIEQEIELSELN